MGSSDMDKSANEAKDTAKESKTPNSQEQTSGTVRGTVNPDWAGFQPADWEDREYIEDPNQVKPEGYDSIPRKIPNPKAKQVDGLPRCNPFIVRSNVFFSLLFRTPDTWDEDEDGVWRRPKIPNPAYKGPWKPKKIKNPDYKGKWKIPWIDNPEFEDDPDLYVLKPIKYVGIDVWQVKAGSVYDKILICDDPEYCKSKK